MKLSCFPGTCTTSKGLKTCTYELLQTSEVFNDLKGIFLKQTLTGEMTKQKNVNRTDALKDSHTEHQEQFLERMRLSISSN